MNEQEVKKPECFGKYEGMITNPVSVSSCAFCPFRDACMEVTK